MALHKVATLAELPPGALIQVDVGEETLALCNAGGQIHALEGVCPHAGGPLGQGALHGTTIVCPWHAWEYDCVTGEHDRNRNVRLAKFAVRVEGEDVLVDVGS
jgi:nitrite reductase/ring-hydroxylating ferredoxin subunit